MENDLATRRRRALTQVDSAVDHSESTRPQSAPLAGNHELTAALEGADTSALSQLALGQLAGDVGPVSVPSWDAASNTAMNRVLRHAGPSPVSRAAARIRPTGGEPLPQDVQQRFSAVLGVDLSGVRIHRGGEAGTQAQALSAHAFAIGEHIWFGSGEYAPGTAAGDRLLMHELTHVRQHYEGRIAPATGSGLQVSNPTDPLEQEAYASERLNASALQAVDRSLASDDGGLADAALALGAGPFVEASAPAAAPVAHRDAQTTTTPAPEAGEEEEESEEPSAPEQVQLTLAGQTITVRLQGEELTQTISLDEEVVPGLRLTEASLAFDAEWSVTSGNVKGKLTIGELVEDADVGLEVQAGGGVRATIEGMEIPFPDDLISGTMDLEVTSDGVGGEATFTHDQIDVGDGLVLEGGSLTITLEPGATTASATGELTGRIGELLPFTLTASMDENRIGGTLEVRVSEAVDLGHGIQLTSGAVTGELDSDGTSTLTGAFGFDLAGIASADLTATYEVPASGGDEGAAEQQGEVPAPVAGDSGEAQGEGGGNPAPTSADGGGLPGMPGGGPQAYGPGGGDGPGAEGGGVAPGGEQSSGEGGGGGGDTTSALTSEGGGGGGGGGGEAAPITLPVPGPGTLDLTGTVTQTTPVSLGDVTVTDTQIGVTVTDNVLQPVTVDQSTLALPDGWQASLTNGTLDIAQKLFSGEVGVELTEALALGNGLTLTTVDATGTLAANTLERVSGDLTAEFRKANLPNLDLEFTGVEYVLAERDLDGVVTATLSDDFVVHQGDTYSLVLKSTSSLEATVTDTELTALSGTLVLEVVEGEEAFLRLQIEGAFPLEEGGTLSGAVSATLIAEKTLGTVAGNTLVLTAGSGLTGTITENQLEKINGTLTVSVREGDAEWASATIEGDYVIGEGEDAGYTGTASITVTGPKDVGTVAGYTLAVGGAESAATASATFTAGDLESITGDIPFTVRDENPLLSGSLNGTYTVEGNTFTGSGRLDLVRPIEKEAGGLTIRVNPGTWGQATITGETITALEGGIEAEVLVDGTPEVSFSGTGSYDVENEKVVQAEGTATLLRPLRPFGDQAVEISNLSATASFGEDGIESLTGNADILVLHPSLNNSRGSFEITWRKEGGEDHISGSGDVHLVIIPENNGRSLAGDVQFTFEGTDSFTVDGDLDFSLTEAIGGSIGMTMDETMDPEIRGDLSISSELIPATDLFDKKFDILPEQNMQFAAGPVPITLGFGALAGVSLGLNALVLSTTIGVSGWRPLSEDSELPSFTSEADLTWGLNLQGLGAAWMQLGIGVAVLSAGAGIRGEAVLDVPIATTADVRLNSDGNEFWGDLGISVGISAGLSFAAIPYLYANLFSQNFTHDFDGWDWDMGEIASFEWGKRYQFGDRSGETDQGASAAPAGAATQGQTEHQTAPSVPETQVTPPASSPGGPDLSGVSSLVGQDEGSGGGAGASEMERRMALIEDLATGVGALGYLMEQLGSLLNSLMTFGPVGLVINLVYKMITGEITWSRLSQAVTDAIAGIQAAYALLEPYLPNWWQKIQEVVQNGINLFDEWWNGDDRMHEAVQNGEHLNTSSDMRGRMAARMLDFWSAESHKHSVLTILEMDSAAVINAVGWDKLKGKMTGWNASDSIEDRFKRWCEANGKGRYVTETGWFGGESQEWEWTD